MEFNSLSWLNNNSLEALNRFRGKDFTADESLLDLSMINPDIPPPRLALDKLTEASLNPTNHRYSSSRGIRKLRDAFAQKYSSAFAVTLDSEEEVLVTLGCKDAFRSALKIFALHGFSALLFTPTYPAHLSAVLLNGMKHSFCSFIRPKEVGSKELRRPSEPDFEEIERKIKELGPSVIILNFPSNPTGELPPQGFYRKLLEVASRNGSFILNDFTYGEMGFKEQPESLLSLFDNPELPLAEVYSLSKAYSVPGWRVGALLGNRKLVRTVTKLKSHQDYGVFLGTQIAATALLNGKYERSIVNTYQRRINCLSVGLRDLGWAMVEPAAGASLWAKFPERYFKLGSVGFAKKLIEEVHIAALPGIVFGKDFDQYIRFALVVDERSIHEVLTRLGRLADENSKSNS